MIDYKLVCYGPGIAVPVPENAKWLCQDLDGEWWVSTLVDRPTHNSLQWHTHFKVAGDYTPPPEPGPWTEQCYWIGD